MNTAGIIIAIVLSLAVLFFLLTYICFRIVFYVPSNKKENAEEYPLPTGKIYEPYYPDMIRWIKEARGFYCEDFTIQSFDGLKRHGKYYEYQPGAPIEIMFHGYRGSAERDLSGGIQRCRTLGRNTLLIDQRTNCGSEGNVISFGINEHRDCLAWVDFTVKHFGPDVKIILTGISMGATTVLMAAGKPLPPQVIGVLADCGFSSAKEIIKKCVRQLHLPADALYPFIRSSAKIFGHFDPEEYSAMEAMKTCQVPVFFLHGEDDDFVPCDMTRALYEACPTRKQLLTVPGAGHGLGYLVDTEGYLRAVSEFFSEFTR